ncbi:phosphatase PAP2 family protein [Clostridium sporogenes]|uniref:Phosphatase PAP2 family protein n=1 Tax=Clostridium sporogenes TaxID=1509 RepID=A0AAE4FM10_CLOSG|nr:phosphatase PAP2 family protein [Clostridium sporogenes]MDS1004278.1 phosphatase PAP2 family protein [Clostridium sporogenes]
MANNKKKSLFINKCKLSSILIFLDKYYSIIIGIIVLFLFIRSMNIPKLSQDYKFYLLLLAIATLTAYKEIRKDVKILPFLILAVPFLLFIMYINKHGYAFWGKMLSWQISRDIVVDLNPSFKNIPFNDAGFARIFQTETLTWFFRLVYNNGFVVPALIPMYRAALSKDFRKMMRYALSAHVLQVFLITPFYLMFHLQEVWYVNGHPDGLARNLSPEAAAGVTLNCFPSMHTSIAFAMFLVVLHEKDKIFKYIWSFFCLSVVYSTMYLEIHWIIDVFGGMILAFVTVKLVDFILDKGKNLLTNILNKFYYKKPKEIICLDNVLIGNSTSLY